LQCCASTVDDGWSVQFVTYPAGVNFSVTVCTMKRAY